VRRGRHHLQRRKDGVQPGLRRLQDRLDELRLVWGRVPRGLRQRRLLVEDAGRARRRGPAPGLGHAGLYAVGDGATKVHVVTTFDTVAARSFALLAYDKSVVSTFTRYQAWLAVVDITDIVNPSVVQKWNITTSPPGTQSWNSTVGIGGSFNNAGWIYQANNNDPCNTYGQEIFSPNLFRPPNTDWEVVFNASGTYPVLISNRAEGMGDYIACIRQGLANGDTFCTRSQPQETTVSGGCIACAHKQYSLHAIGGNFVP
jgi:hypothetical protein